MSRIDSLIAKLKALADRGIGGEKDNAKNKLQELCDKHGINIDDITEDEPLKYNVVWLKDDYISRMLFKQVASTILGDSFSFEYFKYKIEKRPGFNRHFLECKVSEFIEVMAKHEFYERAMEEDLKLFISAFVAKNHLYPNVDNPVEVEWDDTEKVRQFKIAQMSEGLDKRNFHKQIDK